MRARNSRAGIARLDPAGRLPGESSLLAALSGCGRDAARQEGNPAGPVSAVAI